MKILLCGMGNRDHGDDAFGPYVVEQIKETDSIKKIDCNLYPENYLNKIISYNPDLVIFFDTIQKQGSKSVLLRDDELQLHNPISVSTHNLPFSSIYYYLKENSHANIWFLGVRPISYTHLTEEIISSAKRVIDAFDSLDNEHEINIIELYETLSTTLR